MAESTDDFLAHYGIPGMKWGHRKARDISSKISARRGPKVAPSEDYKKVAAIKKQSRRSGTKSLSNKELQDAINRMNLEQQYSRLNPTAVQKGSKVASSIIGNVGKQVASEIVKDAVKTGVEKTTEAVTKKFGG